MKLLIILKYCLCLIFFSLLLLSCRKQDHFYKDFIEGGEIIYVGKADSIHVHPGKNRMKLSWQIKDPNITKMKVYWNTRQDSMVFNVNKSEDIDSVGVIINNLEERFYSFEIYSLDDLGNSSIKMLAEGQVYGDEYNASLLNRVLNNASLNDNNDAVIKWFEPSAQMIGTEVVYEDIDGESRLVFIPDSMSDGLLEDIKFPSTFKYRTLFMPDSLAIDTFFTEYETKEISIEETEFDYSNFMQYKLPGDANDFNTNRVHFLWNKNISDSGSGSGGWYRTATDSGLPNQVTIDMGIKGKISRFKIWQRGSVKENQLLYANANPRKFEVWGSNNPDPGGTYDSWVKLMNGEISKPSGSTGLTAEDIALAQAGHEFILPSNTPGVQYIRIRVIETFDPAAQFFLSNIALFGNNPIIRDN